ncbi:glycerol-3-phosphate-binding periplasmic protein precursor [Legionella beliardensis]|uniref:sn-glycerol-3-phosphate-binding periplasmic protein UgpB n=1 Tax=Legionella beliardensis TaxID=91822 RepID=A0A378I3B1_9GAMM|nr:extracellular solute-binding protein [Legionella beliardensis]STX29250.1 glycerol-3-phosphate-binding periplasmic protein precursor [Legionella beliardensis]
MRRWLFFILFFLLSNTYAAKVEIVLWHSLAGQIGAEVQHLVNGFNKSQTNYFIKSVYKGEYTDTITSFAAAFKAKKPPAIIQVFEVGTGIMLSPKGIIKPLHELMLEQKQPLPTQDFLPALLSFYSHKGELQALPFNTSIPVIFYNADALAKVGVNAHNFPKTWDELEQVAAKLLANGYSCAYTSSYPAWIQIEAFSAIHGLPLVDLGARKAVYNNKALIHHLERLKNWQTRHYFAYGGRASDATVLFTSGKCAMYSQSSGSYASLSELVKFSLGVAVLPLDTSISKVRHSNLNGGAALWAVAGQSDDVYRGIAQFYAYLVKPEIQQHWYQNTGYIPISLTGNYAFIAQHDAQPILALAEKELAKSSQKTLSLFSIPQNQIRMINDEEIEAIFAGIKSPQVAMDDAVTRANFALLRFLRNTKH